MKDFLFASVATVAMLACLPKAWAADTASTQGAPAPAAAGATAQPNTVGEVIVTAQKRSESVQRTALAVTALGGLSLQKQGVTTIAGLSQTVPGLNVSEQVGQARLTLRGIGLDDISTGAESSVAFNQDGVFYSRSAGALASFYDVSRVEVLRGPQGTLYGRNATGGSINIITNQPTTTLHGALNLTGGNYETINGDGFISGPLTDTLSGRLSFQVQHHDGYGKNIVTGDDIDDKNSQAVRGQLLYTPTSRLKILVAGDYYQSIDRSNGYHYLGDAGQTATGAPITPTAELLGGQPASNLRDLATIADPSAHDKFYGARVDVSYDLSDVFSVRSLTAYRRAQYEVHSTISPFSVVELFPLTVQEKSDEYTQEFQFNANTNRNKFVSGLFYMHENIAGSEAGLLNLEAVGGPNFYVQGYYGGGKLTTDAAAFYAQDTYSILPRLRFTLGGRYSWERKAVNDQTDFDFATPAVPDAVPTTPHHIADTHFESFTPKVGLDYDLAPRTLIYASYSEGFKSGTYNLGSTGPAIKPETVDAYEAGLKTTTADGKYRANFAGFYYDYKNLQVGKVEGQIVALENAAAAKIYGLEGEFTAKPIDDLTFNLNTSWLHARFTQYVTADQARPGGDGVTVDPSGAPAYNLNGNELAQSPNYTIDLGAEYAIHLQSGILTPRVESNWSDRVYFTAFDRKSVSQAPYSLQNAFINYEPNGGTWRVSLYLRNIADRTIKASANVASTVVGSPVIGFLLPPRTIGATVGYRF